MNRTDRRTRRSVLQVVGSVAVIGAVAGCTDDPADVEDDPNGDAGGDVEDEVEDEDAEDAGWVEEWEDVETIELEAHTEDGWIGVRPAVVEDVQNPDIALYEGRTYEFVWTNTDGEAHNLAFWDDDGPLVTTDFVDGEGEETTVEIEATDEMAVYLCEAHASSMSGSIEIRTE